MTQPDPSIVPASAEPTGTAPGPAPSLIRRVLTGGAWSLGGYGLSQIMRLASNLVMTRLLAQEAFGLMSIAFSLQMLLIMLSDLGLSPSIIRSPKGADPAFLTTAWVVQIVRGFLIALALVIGAGLVFVLERKGSFPVGSVWSDPRLPAFVLLVAVNVIVDCFKSVSVPLYERDMRLGPVIGLELTCQLFGILVMIAAVMAGAGAFSLAIGMIATSALLAVASHIFLQAPPMRFRFDRSCFNEIFSFGKWLLLASFLGFLMQRGDQFVFGTIMPRGDFGLYAIATIWISGALLLTDRIMARVAFPSLSEVFRLRPDNLTRAYYRLRLPLDVAFVGLYIAGLFLIKPIFGVLYTEDFADVGTYLVLLMTTVLLLPYRVLNNLLLAAGRSDVFVLMVLGPTIWMMVGVPIIYYFTDIRTAIVFSTLAGVASLPVAWWLTGRYVRISYIREIPLLIFAVVMAWRMAVV